MNDAPWIELLESEAGAAVRTQGSGRLVDVCDEAAAPVVFSCRGATCGTCRVEVLDGAALLEPPGEDEVRLLARHGGHERYRLACQAVVVARPGHVVLRWVGMAVRDGQ